MQHALMRVGLVSDDSHKHDNTPKITLDVSLKKVSIPQHKKKKEIKKKLSLKSKKQRTDKKKYGKSRGVRINKTKKSSSKKKISVNRKQANEVAVQNLQELGFKSPKHAMDYWRSVKDVFALEVPSKTDLDEKGIKNPLGLPWTKTDWKKFLSTIEYIDLVKPKNNSEGKETQKTKQEPQKKEPQKKEETHNTLRDFDTDTLFDRYRDALISLSKKNPKLSITARKLIDEINQEFLRRFEGSIDKDGYFVWPSTKVYASNIGLSKQMEWQKNGVLLLYGYRVGETNGLDENKRRVILDEVFTANIPPVLDKSYIDEWSRPSSASRLEKMAIVLASLAKNEKKRGQSLIRSYREREDDLQYLYDKYYVGKFGFGWPST